jgi:hypothetical protein
LARYTTLRIGKPLNIEDLKQTSAKASRAPNPRDEDLAVLINEVAAGPESQVIPWHFGDTKPATARVAANRAINRADLRVFAFTHRGHPKTLFFSRQALTKRRRKQVTA